MVQMIKFILYAVIGLQITLFAQTDYTMKLTNPIQINENLLEFDITINSTGPDFYITSYQCAFSFDLDFTPKDSLDFYFIENSSEFDNYPQNLFGLDTIDGTNKLLFVSGIGRDLINQDEKLVGRFGIFMSKKFELYELNLKWDFEGSTNTILTGEDFANITKPANHINFDNTITDLDIPDGLPNKFELSQNYPNPFNPTTTIKYNIPFNVQNGASNVKITVYDVLGRKMVTLVDEQQKAGSYEIQFDASNFASGTYFYELSTNSFRNVKKMILLK
jgi:hypothetical protein